MPAKGSLESIGSVRAMHERANAETADNSDFGKFQHESDPHANHIFAMFGQEAYDEYIRDVAAQRQREKSEATEKLARRTARMRRFLNIHTRIEHKLATLVTNVASKVVQRHITA
ncbi:hypothetical protein HO173_001928 [Letharia columbiana]|uniref:Uncharacterized protein n=1 Tax=Letharia columbiana TaxID=112416 RepID=A0A8H6G4G1_9LECA|nr:uncharacterized protein HO173_001928 [Letharia columbiana]KAF6240317.1 hypothetical protein HO173_001928 [Letharia columbiana]